MTDTFPFGRTKEVSHGGKQGRNPADLYPSGILDRRSWAILWPVAFPKPLRTGRKRRLRLSQEVRGRPPRWEISYLGRLLGADPSLSTVDQAMHRRWRGEDTIHPRPPSPDRLQPGPDRVGGFER